MLKTTLWYICLFSAIFAYFVFGSGWYEPAELLISGTADLDSSLTVQWDSGSGLNPYEQRKFSFLPFHGDAETNIAVRISGGGERNKASSGSEVILYEVRLDDKGIDIPPSALTNVQQIRGKGWVFQADDSEINLHLPATQRVSFLFKTSNQSGIVRLSINGVEMSRDLYRRNWALSSALLDFWLLDENRNFTVSFHVPRYAIEQLYVSGTDTVSFSSVALADGSGAAALTYEQSAANMITVVAPNERLKRSVHPIHLVLQALFALLVSSLLFAAGSALSRGGGLKQALTRHTSAWLFFCGACAVYGLWLLAFWPGIMSVDSLNIWRAAILPEVMINDHPYVNELWYFFLSRIWNHTAIVPVVQIVLLSILIACVLGFMVRRGISPLLIVPVYVLFLLSVPIGLYNATLWKDVPFALLVVFWALVPAYLYFKKREGERVHITKMTGILLFLSFICLVTFRHNGLVYLFVIPLLMLALGLVRVPKAVLALGCLGALALCYLIVFPPANLKSASYFHDLSRMYLQQFGQEPFKQRVQQSLVSYPRLLDIKKNQENSDFWHYYLKDRYAYRFLQEAGWSDVYPYQDPEKRPFSELRKTALKIYPASLEYPWLYMSWYPFPLLYLFPLSILLCRWFPLSAVFSTVILAQVAALLLFVGTTNWRYYYFVLVGGYFLLPLILLDFHLLRHRPSPPRP